MNKFLGILILMSFSLAYSETKSVEYNFCGYRTISADPQASKQFKELGINDSYTVKPNAVKSKNSEKSLDNIILGSGKTLNKYDIKPYSISVAKSDYIELPALGPFMMTWSDKYNKNIPAAWVYWLGDGETVIDGHYQPHNRVLEPINFIFIVKGFSDSSQANKYLVSQIQKAGFTKEYSDQHTSGYSGIFKVNDVKVTAIKQIGGQVNGKYHGYTFEDTDNPNTGGDHFRVFGPYQNKKDQAYIYTASLSQESPRYIKNGKRCGHMFESFTKAKSILALGLLDNTKANIYATNLFTTIPDKVVKPSENVNTYFTGDQQVTNSQISNIAFVAVFDHKQ